MGQRDIIHELLTELSRLRRIKEDIKYIWEPQAKSDLEIIKQLREEISLLRLKLKDLVK